MQFGHTSKARKSKTIIFKSAGGAAAQTLCLMNAIQIKQRTNIPFKIKYYPHSTGTYWPFEINFLLAPVEIFTDNAKIHGLRNQTSFSVGKVIKDHPLDSHFFSYEHLLKFIRRLKIDFMLRLLRREVSLEAQKGRLEMISKKTKSVSGGYVPISDSEVIQELDRRYKISGRRFSPFSRDDNFTHKYVAIHYRIGDKRAEFTRNSELAGDGIFSPESFRQILEQNENFQNYPIYVISDEPKAASALLSTVGIEAQSFQDCGDIWKDIYYLTHSKLLLGSWSQVSQLAASIMSNFKGTAFLPSKTRKGKKVKWNLPYVSFFEPIYLQEDHPVYTQNLRAKNRSF